MNRLDAHHHLWDPQYRRPPWWDARHLPIQRRFLVPELTTELAEHGFDASVVVQAFTDERETLDLLALAAESGPVEGVVGWVDLAAPHVDETIDRLRSAPGGEYLVGVRHPVHDEPDPRWLLRPDVVRGLLAVAAAGLAFDLLVKPRELAAAAILAERLPQLRLVLDHLGKPAIPAGSAGPAAWRQRLTALAERDNVTCKLSGLVTEASWSSWQAVDLVAYVQAGLEAFGAERCMFGSDWPVCLLAGSYGQVLDVVETAVGGLTTQDSDLVFGGNARRVYRLSAQTSPHQPNRRTQ